MRSFNSVRCLAAHFAIATLVVGVTPVMATPSGACETSAARATPHGAISKTECGNAQGGRRNTINIDSVAVLSDVELFKEDYSDKYGYFVS